MYHCKVMIVDDCWTSIGSANFDNRSFRLNDESNLNVYDADFAREQVGAFEHDQERSRPSLSKNGRIILGPKSSKTGPPASSARSSNVVAAALSYFSQLLVLFGATGTHFTGIGARS